MLLGSLYLIFLNLLMSFNENFIVYVTRSKYIYVCILRGSCNSPIFEEIFEGILKGEGEERKIQNLFSIQ